jgi:mycothiol synthase
MTAAGGDEVEIAGAPTIGGLRFRRWRGEADLPGMLEVYNEAHRANGLEELATLAEMRVTYQHLRNCDPARDLVVAEVDGRLVGYARVFWSELNEGGRAYQLFGFIHPEWRGKGIGRALLRHNERRQREIAAEHAGIAPKWLSSESVDSDRGCVRLLESEGYAAVRHYYEMVRPDLEEIPEVPLPEGIELRPASRDQYRAIWEADTEAFRDHWGERDESEEAYRHFVASPSYADPRLWQVAWDGDEIAGLVINTVNDEENREFGRARGWLDSVAVRRPWRRRGLARALIAASLRALRDAGLTSAGLGVDTQNPLGALRLYESVGFVPERRFIEYRKEL